MKSAEEIYALFQKHPGISTDSRDIRPGTLFFAIRGSHFDGNRFANDALNNGAAYAIVDDPDSVSDQRYILVDDTLATLQEIAMIHRSGIRAKVIGITGSNGKTTTKELTSRVLSNGYNTLATKGNFNNHIGVPLTVLSITPQTQLAVIEMGANHPGEIAALCQVARPDYGIITNIGKAHLEGFGSYDGVIKAKSELYDFLRTSGGTAIVNQDDPLLIKLSKGLNTIFYGSGEEARCYGRIIKETPFLGLEWSAGNISGSTFTQLTGTYNFGNILAAICAGVTFDIEPQKIDEAVSSYLPDNNRSQWLITKFNTLILDAYNANPSSMSAALMNFSTLEGKSKVAILGDMMELGIQSAEEHAAIVSLARRLKIDEIILVGEQFTAVSPCDGERCFPDTEQAAKWIEMNPLRGKTILIKGSRKMHLEKLANLL
ncbi:MAG TPA: UDP-N-acetylmuramoyl-tripeptide--D-alanyl-D-alanine ligase [Bacteroidales bacterium]|nr:UDP-N-acetylmuramoyl-tripeptide--D-alanyl-D-alanine ligase [Bacteroidales bacterium]HPI87432.1 UDP-N-acetylmuramoyl-tripeptide--D-alanyl-D-alanine ligase [Bacteroidales bacterium]